MSIGIWQIVTILIFVIGIYLLFWKMRKYAGIIIGIAGILFYVLNVQNEMSKGISFGESFYSFFSVFLISSTILLWSVLLNKNMNLIFQSFFGVLWFLVMGYIFFYFIDYPTAYAKYFVLQPVLWFVILFISIVIAKYKSKEK